MRRKTLNSNVKLCLKIDLVSYPARAEWLVNMIIPIVNGAFGTVTKGLLKGLKELDIGRRVETIQTLLHYWEWPEYWEEYWGLEEICCHSNSSERPSANANVKISNSNYDNNNNDKPCEFFHTSFNWSPSKNTSPQISRTFLSVRADFNSAVIWFWRFFLQYIFSPVSFPGFLRPSKGTNDNWYHRQLHVS